MNYAYDEILLNEESAIKSIEEKVKADIADVERKISRRKSIIFPNFKFNFDRNLKHYSSDENSGSSILQNNLDDLNVINSNSDNDISDTLSNEIKYQIDQSEMVADAQEEVRELERIQQELKELQLSNCMQEVTEDDLPVILSNPNIHDDDDDDDVYESNNGNKDIFPNEYLKYFSEYLDSSPSSENTILPDEPNLYDNDRMNQNLSTINTLILHIIYAYFYD